MHLIILASLASLFPTPVQPQYYDSIYKMSQQCKNRCENLRPKGHTDPFQGKCDEKPERYWGDTERCRNDCTNCPTFICDPANPNIYNCPEVDFPMLHGPGYFCWSYCDGYRDLLNKTLEGFSYQCGGTRPWDKCCRDCPPWICDLNNENKENFHHCPPVFHGICKKRCADNRKRKFGDDHYDAFQFSCKELKKEKEELKRCQNFCKECPDFVCDYDTDRNIYNCPAIPKPTKPTTTTTTSSTTTVEAITAPKKKYAGRCQKRCDKFRLGGNGACTFNCHTLFIPGEEQDKCKEDCEYCPDDVCISYQHIYSCPAKDHAVPNAPKKEKPKSSVALTVSIILAVLSTVFFLVMTTLYCKSRNPATVGGMPVPHQQFGVQPFGGQNQQINWVGPGPPPTPQRNPVHIEASASSSISNFYTDSGSGLSESASGQSQGQGLGQDVSEMKLKKTEKKRG